MERRSKWTFRSKQVKIMREINPSSAKIERTAASKFSNASINKSYKTNVLSREHEDAMFYFTDPAHNFYLHAFPENVDGMH